MTLNAVSGAYRLFEEDSDFLFSRCAREKTIDDEEGVMELCASFGAFRAGACRWYMLF